MTCWLADRLQAHADSSPRAGLKPSARGRVPDRAEIAGRLECACKDKTPAVILVRDTGDILRGRFEKLGSSQVTLLVEPTGPTSAPRQLGVCCVSFVHDERAFVFLAPLWRLVDAPGSGDRKLLSVGTPGQMATLDLGSARRIPIPPGAAPTVEVATYDRRRWAPRVVDLSATGVLLDFGEERPPRLPLGALVEISIRFGGARAVLTAAVRRCDGACVALSFLRAATDAAAQDEGGLDAILQALEERWLDDDAG